MRARIGLVCVWSLLLPAWAWAGPERGLDLVVMISNEALSRNDGAGFILGYDEEYVYIATANHVVRDLALDTQDHVVTVAFRLAPPVTGTVHADRYKERDVAFVLVPREQVPGRIEERLGSMTRRLGAPRPLQRSDVVHSVGNADQKEWKIGGEETFVQVNDATGDIEFASTWVEPGQSGGALLDRRGRVVGMVVRDNPPRAVPLAAIQKIASDLKLGVEAPPVPGRTLKPLIGGGITVTGVGLGLVTASGVWALSHADQFEKRPDGKVAVAADDVDAFRQVRTMQHVGGVAIGVGLVATGVGLTVRVPSDPGGVAMAQLTLRW